MREGASLKSLQKFTIKIAREYYKPPHGQHIKKKLDEMDKFIGRQK